jgi:hypothetical protein
LAHPFNKTWQKEGVSGFFRGLTPSLAQIALNTGQFLNYLLPYFLFKIGIKFTAYNWINSEWSERQRQRRKSTDKDDGLPRKGIEELFSRLASGAIAGIVAKSITVSWRWHLVVIYHFHITFNTVPFGLGSA